MFIVIVKRSFYVLVYLFSLSLLILPSLSFTFSLSLDSLTRDQHLCRNNRIGSHDLFVLPGYLASISFCKTTAGYIRHSQILIFSSLPPSSVLFIYREVIPLKNIFLPAENVTNQKSKESGFIVKVHFLPLLTF